MLAYFAECFDLQHEELSMASIRKRINSKGNISYSVQVRIKGRPSEAATFKRKTDAELWAQQTEADTGARKMEIVGLKWSDIDFDRGVIILQETKNGERRLLPLQGFALKLMKQHNERKNISCDYVFASNKIKKDPSTGKFLYRPIDIRTAWENVIIKAKILDFRFHDLRHSAASYLAMDGASVAEIAEILGHKTLQMVKRYAHLSEAHTTSVVASMNERIFGNG